MSADTGKDKNVLADKQKFGKDEHLEHNEKLEHEAKNKVAHMGEHGAQTSKPGSPGKP
jgi:hypothetical protein